MKTILQKLLRWFTSETTQVPPGETEYDYIPLHEINPKKKPTKSKTQVKFHPKVTVKPVSSKTTKVTK